MNNNLFPSPAGARNFLPGDAYMDSPALGFPADKDKDVPVQQHDEWA